MKAAKAVVESYETARKDFMRQFFVKLENAIQIKLKSIENLKLKRIKFFDLDKQIDEYYNAKRSAAVSALISGLLAVGVGLSGLQVIF